MEWWGNIKGITLFLSLPLIMAMTVICSVLSMCQSLYALSHLTVKTTLSECTHKKSNL